MLIDGVSIAQEELEKTDAYKHGRAKGHDEGYSEGWDDGYEEGYDVGFTEGETS